METNSRPMSAELTVALVTKKLSNCAGTIRRKFEPSTLVGFGREMRRSVGRSAFSGVMVGLATAAGAEAVRPPGATPLLLDWGGARGPASAGLDNPALARGHRGPARVDCRALADT